VARTTSNRVKAGRPLWWAAGLSLVLVAGAGLLVFSLLHDDTYVAPTPPPAVSGGEGPRSDLAAAALRRFVTVVRRGEERVAGSLAPRDDPGAAARLRGIVANAQRARVRDFTARFVSPHGAYVDGGWSGTADVTWRFAGFDRHTARAEVDVHFHDEGDRTAIVGLGGGGHVSPLWLDGPLQVDRSGGTLVLVDGTPRRARSYDEQARVAVRVVRRVLPTWHAGLVVEVPASERSLERTLHARAGSYRQIAAVTTSPDGSTAAHAPVHVFVNADVFDDLRRQGAQVVLSHEATHVATGAFVSPMPLWLLEGFADYVALRDVPLPVSRSAAQVAAEVRRHGAPARLPSDAAFGPRTADLGATYEAAWLAVRQVALDAGERALVRFYDDANAGTPVARALPRATGLTVRALTDQWHHELRRLAARGGGR
jgi:hypothetical protein